MKKQEITVKTIKYNLEELPIIVNFNGNFYIISEIYSKEDNTVFYQGGTGTKWTVIINKKETALYHDKHNHKWYVYVEGYNSPNEHRAREPIEITDMSYLN